MSCRALVRIGLRRSYRVGRGGAAALSLAVLVVHGTAAVAAPAPPAAAADQMPSFSEVQTTVNEYFVSIKRTPNDLISQGDVKPIFEQLATRGWRVADQAQISRALLTDKDFLVKKLRSGRGRNFARTIAQLPEGYDRVDRLSRLPHGHTFLDGLISTADGWKIIAYMTEAPGGHVLGEQISHAPLGHHFNAATRRIYTSDQFLDRLRLSYEKTTGQTIAIAPKKKPPPRSLINVVPRD